MKITLELDADQVALLCGTLMRAANQYPDSPNQRELFDTVEAAVDSACEYVCDDEDIDFALPNKGDVMHWNFSLPTVEEDGGDDYMNDEGGIKYPEKERPQE